MQKSTIFLIIGLMIMATMACGLGISVQEETESQSPDSLDTGIISTKKTSTPAEDIPVAEGTLSSNDTESSSLIENSPTPTIDSITIAKNCLAKTWEIEGLSDYVVAAVPPELAAEYNLQYEDTTGKAYLILSHNDQVVLQADNLEINLKARVSIFEVPVKVSIDGMANGSYDIDGSTLRTDHMDTDGLTASAKALDEELIDQDQIIESIPFVRAPYNAAEFSCQGDRLELEMSGYPEDIPPLVFRAVK